MDQASRTVSHRKFVTLVTLLNNVSSSHFNPSGPCYGNEGSIGDCKKAAKRVFVILEEMTTEEKRKAMEILWEGFCRSVPDFSSPSWHEDILKERD